MGNRQIASMSFANGYELSDMQNEGSKNSSPWGGMSQKRSRVGSGSMKVGLLGTSSSSSSSTPGSSNREALRSLVEGEEKSIITVHPCTICCTIFSTISAICLLLLGIYGGADAEGKYLILVEGGVAETGGSRGGQVGHIIGAAVCYAMFAGGCGVRWWKQKNGDDVSLLGRRQL